MTFLTEAWFWRGTQSAIFYYLSCAPCTKLSDQRKKRRDGKRARAEREMAGTFQHPLPSNTNPGWNEEIILGPGPPPKRMGKKEMRRRDRLKIKISETIDLESTAPAGPNDNRIGTGTTSLDTADGKPVSQGLSQQGGDSWNRQRYQREDEILWGRKEDENSISSKGFSPISRTTSGAGSHYYARNPEVNDLHPPVVSAYSSSKTETQWMLQPPPKAKIMSGKESPNRSRSGSGTSGDSSLASRGSSRRGKGENLGRSIGARLLEEKVARGEGPPPTTSAASLTISRGGSNLSVATSASGSSTIRGQRHERDQALTTGSKDSLTSQPQAERDSGLSRTECYDMTHLILARPPLPTIPSVSNTPLLQSPKAAPGRPLRPPLITTQSASSLQTLQLHVPSSKISSTREDSMLDIARSVRLPPTPREEKGEEAVLDVQKWKPAGEPANSWSFPFPTLDVATGHRWSMDI